MGGTALVVAGGALAVSSGLQYVEAKKDRRAAERQAELERQALAELQVQSETPMLLADDAAARAARRRSITSQMRRRGRQSTILTSPESSDTLGS